MLGIFNIDYKCLFKEVLLDRPLGKTEFYVYCVEFQVRGSPHIHSFLYIKEAPKMTLETEQQYINFVESKVSAKLPDPSELTKFIHILGLVGNITRTSVSFTMVVILLIKLSLLNLCHQT